MRRLAVGLPAASFVVALTALAGGLAQERRQAVSAE